MVLLPVLLAVVAASSCAGGGAERGRNADGGSGGAVGEGGAGGFGGDDCGPVDFTSDPRNCGTCGHDCLGGACEVFACQPYVVAQFAEGSIDGLTSHGDSILIAAELLGPNGFQDGIYRLPLAGGEPTLLTETGDNQNTRMATDDTHLYWTSSSTPQDQLLATDLSSGQTEVLAAAAWSDVARVGQRLFFYDGTAIQAFDLTTKDITTVAPTSYEDSWLSIHADDERVYWTGPEAAFLADGSDLQPSSIPFDLIPIEVTTTAHGVCVKGQLAGDPGHRVQCTTSDGTMTTEVATLSHLSRALEAAESSLYFIDIDGSGWQLHMYTLDDNNQKVASKILARGGGDAQLVHVGDKALVVAASTQVIAVAR